MNSACIAYFGPLERPLFLRHSTSIHRLGASKEKYKKNTGVQRIGMFPARECCPIVECSTASVQGGQGHAGRGWRYERVHSKHADMVHHHSEVSNWVIVVHQQWKVSHQYRTGTPVGPTDFVGECRFLVDSHHLQRVGGLSALHNKSN